MRFCACACAPAVSPCCSWLFRLLSFPIAELAFGEPAPKTVLISETRLSTVVHVPAREFDRACGVRGLVGPPRRESGPHDARSAAPTKRPRHEAMRRRMRFSGGPDNCQYARDRGVRGALPMLSLDSRRATVAPTLRRGHSTLI